MLKKRLVATILVNNGVVIQSRKFSDYLPVGKPEIAVEFLDDWGIDEIILLDISAKRILGRPDYSLIRRLSKRCHVPLTVGGGVSCAAHIFELLNCGADRVSINQVLLHEPSLVSEWALLFGSQCIVASIDAVKFDGDYFIYDYVKKARLKFLVEDIVKKIQKIGAGEILINSVDRDGSKVGFDIDLVRSVCESSLIPVICSGGAGRPDHFVDVFSKTRTNAAAAANFFHFTEHSVSIVKSILARSDISVRNDGYDYYAENSIDEFGRLEKKSESVLENLLFMKIEKETI